LPNQVLMLDPRTVKSKGLWLTPWHWQLNGFPVLLMLCLWKVFYICYHYNILWSYLLILVFVESVIIIGKLVCLDYELNVCYSQHTVLPLSFKSWTAIVHVHFFESNGSCSR
jgi:hypothetical protein